MPIDPEFPKNHQVICKHKHADCEHFHFVWGPGRTAESAENEEVKKSSEARSEQIVHLGVHGAMVVVVDWDSCYADRACIEACPVQVYQWYWTEQYVPAIEMQNAISEGNSENSLGDGRKDYTDKSDPIREHGSIWCIACVSDGRRKRLKWTRPT
jgi:NAD-dependent dihydropyrimidine dehydrogenase PreA subunit